MVERLGPSPELTTGTDFLSLVVFLWPRPDLVVDVNDPPACADLAGAMASEEEGGTACCTDDVGWSARLSLSASRRWLLAPFGWNHIVEIMMSQSRMKMWFRLVSLWFDGLDLRHMCTYGNVRTPIRLDVVRGQIR